MLRVFLAASISVFPVACYFVSIFHVFREHLASDAADKMEKPYSDAAVTTVLQCWATLVDLLDGVTPLRLLFRVYQRACNQL